METKFNFNSQVCTSRLQSEKLLALGLKKETADMHYALVKQAGYPEWDYFLMPSPITNETFESIPAWSLHRLIEMLALVPYEIYPKDNIYNEVIDDIEEAIKEGYFNKEYLEE